jgi:hypothetical protein
VLNGLRASSRKLRPCRSTKLSIGMCKSWRYWLDQGSSLERAHLYHCYLCSWQYLGTLVLTFMSLKSCMELRLSLCTFQTRHPTSALSTKLF